MHQEHCPVCNLVQKETIKEGELCCLVSWGNEKVVVAKDHIDFPSADSVKEALELANYEDGKYVLSDFNDGVGHWGMTLIPIVPFAQAKSVGKS